MLKRILPESLTRAVDFDARALAVASEIVAAVKQEGASAVLRYTKAFDAKEAPDTFSLFVAREEMKARALFPDAAVESALTSSIENIEAFHKEELERSFFSATKEGAFLSQRIVPLTRVGVYVPGGKAFYPSSLIMTLVPAKTAGVKEIVIFTPPDIRGELREEIYYYADKLGAHTIVKAGGAQAVALAAFGDKNAGFLPCDKIVGPGNVYVTLAKKLVYGSIGVDMLAGPSEIMIVADETANARYVARDLLSQAEHDENARVALVTTSEALLNAVNKYLKDYTETAPRKAIIEASLGANGNAVIARDVYEALRIANEFAPEHLEVMTKLSDTEVMGIVKNAGSVFLGAYAPEPLGDYFIGANHTLPTYGSARFSSPLGVYDFFHRVNFIAATKDYLKNCGERVMQIARYEGLAAHAEAIEERLRDIDA